MDANAQGLQSQQVSYDAGNDRLTVQVEQVSLKAVLSRIALLSGIEVLMDPRVERQVSTVIEGQALEYGIKRLVRGLNSVFLYGEPDTTKGTKPMLVSLRLLPQGEVDGSMLEPLMLLEGEALLRMMTKRAQANSAKENLAVQRWDQRLKQLPSEYRERIIRVAKKQRQQLELRRKMHNERQERSALRHVKLLAEKERSEEILRLADPERYELRRQRLSEIEQAMFN